MPIGKFGLLLSSLLFAFALCPPNAFSEDAAPAQEFSKEQLDQMLAPIALYPDDLLTNVLTASTYPLEVVQAARWRKEPANAKLKGDALAKALEAKDWDPSVKALTDVPDVLQTMSEKLDWTQNLGDAFLAQQDDVMAEIQLLRKKADEAGNLKTNKQQKVSKQDDYIIIEPATPEVIYVPVYQPTVVYGAWWYPNYPPYYWYWGHPASSFVSGFYWGAGFAVANSIWGWGHYNWRRNNIDIDIDRYNRINVNRPKITSNTWVHDPKHRGKVPYRGKEARDKFGGPQNKIDDARKDFRGFDKDKAGDAVRDKVGDGGAGKIKDKIPEGAAGKVKDRVGEGGGAKAKDKAAAIRSRDIPKSRPSPSALDIKPKSNVSRDINRGSASRKIAASHPAAGRARAGGGGRIGGGGRRR